MIKTPYAAMPEAFSIHKCREVGLQKGGEPTFVF
jgi:hypothetical protein